MGLLEAVKKVILTEGLIEKDDRVLLAISGGIDSVALFFVLNELKKEIPFDIGLAHINHTLRGEESERDEFFVRKISERFGVPLFVERVNVKEYARKNRLSIQHAARNLRYDSLFSIAKNNNYTRIAIAHTLDDQIETFFMRVLKGTGIRGISAIPIKRGLIIRPFLFTTRKEIESYCAKNGIEYVEDSSNKKTTYLRNYIRHMVIPHFYKINPKFQEKVLNLLLDLDSVNRFFDERAKRFIGEKVKHSEHGYIFGLKDLREIDEETRFRILSEIAGSLNPNFILQRNHLKLIDRLLSSRNPCSFVKLPGGVLAERSYDSFFLKNEDEEKSIDFVFELEEGLNRLEAFGLTVNLEVIRRTPDFNPYTNNRTVAYLDGEKVKKLKVRTFRDGDRFIPLGLKSPVKLKDFFIKNKIPKKERRKIPLFVSNGEIVWVFGLRIDERFKVNPETKTVLKLEATSH